VAFLVLARSLFWWLLGLWRLRNILWTPDCWAAGRLIRQDAPGMDDHGLVILIWHVFHSDSGTSVFDVSS